MATRLDLTNFMQTNQNILAQGNIQTVINHIDNQATTPQQKIDTLMDCLVQTLSLRGTYAEKC